MERPSNHSKAAQCAGNIARKELGASDQRNLARAYLELIETVNYLGQQLKEAGERAKKTCRKPIDIRTYFGYSKQKGRPW
jgi:hypothetical protein